MYGSCSPLKLFTVFLNAADLDKTLTSEEAHFHKKIRALRRVERSI